MSFDPKTIACLAAVLDCTTPFAPNLCHTTVEDEIERRAKLAVARAEAIMRAACNSKEGGAS